MCECVTYLLFKKNYNITRYSCLIIIVFMYYCSPMRNLNYNNSHSTITIFVVIIVLHVDVRRASFCVLYRYIRIILYSLLHPVHHATTAIVSMFFTSYSAILSISSSCSSSIHVRNPVIMWYNYFTRLKQNTCTNNIYHIGNIIILL